MASGNLDNIEFVDNTDLFINAMGTAIGQALNAIGIQATTYAKLKCPVDTGRLRNSITYTISGAGDFSQEYHDSSGAGFMQDVGGTSDEKTVVIGTNVEYAPFVELGTRKRKPKPFLAPAAKNHSAEYRRIALMYMQDS